MAGFFPVKVTVAWAQKVSGLTRPVSHSAPLGRSAATRRQSCWLHRASSSPASRGSSPRKLNPNTQSTRASAWRMARSAACRSPGSFRQGTFSGSRAKASLARPVWGSPWTSTTVHTAPRRKSSPAQTKPSPPLLPLPQSTTTRRPWMGRQRFSTSSATAAPARSIMVPREVPVWAAACSRRCISSLQNSFIRLPHFFGLDSSRRRY